MARRYSGVGGEYLQLAAEWESDRRVDIVMAALEVRAGARDRGAGPGERS